VSRKALSWSTSWEALPRPPRCLPAFERPFACTETRYPSFVRNTESKLQTSRDSKHGMELTPSTDGISQSLSKALMEGYPPMGTLEFLESAGAGGADCAKAMNNSLVVLCRATPNPSIEGTHKRLRLLRSPHVKR